MERKQTHLKYGIIAGLVMIVINYLVYHFKLDGIPGMTLIPYLPLTVVILLNARAYSAVNEANVTFPNVFGSCFKVTLTASLLSAIYIIVCIYAFPAMKDKYLEIARASMAKNPKITDEMINNNLQLMSKAYIPMMIFFTVGYNLVAGFISSLLGAAIAKKNPEISEEN